nr:tRNA pseudouridine(38-40) synthase TruA [Bacteroidota bacterium]
MRYFIQLSYDGTDYHGWQIQENSISIQQLIETGLRFKAGFNGHVTGCGRTDAGVHAVNFYCHFDHPVLFEPTRLSDLKRNMNNYLPGSIVIHKIFRVRKDAHSRFDALSRTYKYHIATEKNPFNNRYAWLFTKELNINLMNEACEIMKEYHDFTSFSKLHSNVKTNNCKIYSAGWDEMETRLVFTVKADRFLRNMVRAMVGTLIRVGKEKLNIQEFRRVIESKNRQNAGPSVPAHGLFLHEIEYDWDEILPG